jgi:hypothetical protein
MLRYGAVKQPIFAAKETDSAASQHTSNCVYGHGGLQGSFTDR